MISTFTGELVSRIDIDPVAIEDFVCASSVALRPSQPISALPAWPSPISGCDLREVGLHESLIGWASVTTYPSSGRWQLAQDVLPDAEMRVSKKRSRPRLASALFSTGSAAGRRSSALVGLKSLA